MGLFSWVKPLAKRENFHGWIFQLHILCIFYIKYLGRNGFSPAPPVVPTDGHDLWPAITQGFFILKYFSFLLQDLTPLALLLSTTLTWTTRVKRSRCFFSFSPLQIHKKSWPPPVASGDLNFKFWNSSNRWWKVKSFWGFQQFHTEKFFPSEFLSFFLQSN